MKYLKLITIENIPDYIEDYELKKSHITFSFFGKDKADKVDIEHLTNTLSKLSTFRLFKGCEDKFGANKDIPVITYKVEGDRLKGINECRNDIITKNEVLDQNFAIWNPHVSKVKSDKCPIIIHVIGVQSSDEQFKYYFENIKDIIKKQEYLVGEGYDRRLIFMDDEPILVCTGKGCGDCAYCYGELEYYTSVGIDHISY